MTRWHEREWLLDAGCQANDPESWSLPNGGGMALTEENRLAIRICGNCPVKQPCAQYALTEWPAGVILAGIPIRRGQGDQRSATSETLLRAIVGDAA